MYENIIFVFVYICAFGLADLFLEYFKINNHFCKLIYYCSFGIIALIMIYKKDVIFSKDKF